MLNYYELTPMQLDFLKELTNIGGGNAATALSQITDRKIQMEVPKVTFVSYQELFSDYIRMEEEVLAVSIRVHGDTPGNFLFIIKNTDISDFLDMLTPNLSGGFCNQLAVSAIQEVGNILCSSYWNALSRLLDLTVLSSVPAYTQDMFGAIMTSAYIESGQYEDTLLFIENIFKTNSAKVKAHLFFIPLPGSLEKIISISNV